MTQGKQLCNFETSQFLFAVVADASFQTKLQIAMTHGHQLEVFVVPEGTKQFLLCFGQWVMAEKHVVSASKGKLDTAILWTAPGVHAPLVICGDGLWFAVVDYS